MPAKARRWLNTSGDYQVVSGNLRGDDGWTSKALLALRTRKGSCLVFPEFGSRLHEITRADERGRKLAEKRGLEAVEHLAAEVDELTVTAALVDEFGQKLPAGMIDVVVSGKKGKTDLTARYTAVAAGGA